MILSMAFARLLYHELAHANDYIPLSSIDELNSSESIGSITWDNYNGGRLISKKLYDISPLKSQELINIGLGSISMGRRQQMSRRR